MKDAKSNTLERDMNFRRNIRTTRRRNVIDGHQ
jgi:hypothetical protein